MDNKSEFINREISWLSFNERVLQEAEDTNVPLFERLRFIGIFSNNLDEFFRVRVASVRRMVDLGEDTSLLGNFTPEELHEKIQEIVIRQQEKSHRICETIQKEMASQNIFMINEKHLTDKQGIIIKRYFHNKVLQNLVPIMLSGQNKFPYLRDRSVYLAVKLSRKEKSEKFAFALIRIPGKSLSRFFVLPEERHKKYVIYLDDIIRFCLPDIFSLFNYDCFQACTIKVTRDAELDLDDDISKSFIEKMKLSLKKRKKGTPVRLLYDREIPHDLLDFIVKKMNISPENMVSGERYHNDKDFMDFPEIGEPYHYYRQLPPIRHKDLHPHNSILRELRQKDIILHYPYESFTQYIDFLREAAIDPQVKEIGITIYRVATNSRVINVLLNAIRNGKKVTVVIELQARFDEEANIYWSNKLQEEGAVVINGLPGLKVHAKLTWIKRKEKNIFRNYAYIGTGNFNESTARIYADEGLLTSDPRIANEVSKLFSFFKQNYLNCHYNHIIVSPFMMREYFSNLIDNEIKIAKSGRRGYMILKMNSLIDPGMMDKLYEAARAGVKIKLIVRGIFGLIINQKDLHGNIEAISIVDKYLEHSRIFLFGNGGKEKFFISSADWMPRNLNRRIEVACPIYDEKIQQELKKMLKIQLRDNTKSRILDNTLSNNYNRPHVLGRFRAQEDYYQYIKDINHIPLTIYYNPRCRKCRSALLYIKENGYDIEIRNYLQEGNITKKEILEISKKMNCSITDLISKNSTIYRTNYKNKIFNEEEWIDILICHPQLLIRPIVFTDKKAILAHPIEKIEELF